MGIDANTLEVETGIRLVRAPNPSPMTHTGTNTWIVGRGTVAVIDPGPRDDAHLSAILATLNAEERIAAIFVTHAHRDHSSLAPLLSLKTEAPVYGAGGLVVRRRPTMARLAEIGQLGGGEGIDAEFVPDLVLEDGQVVGVGDIQLHAIATPGHTSDHLCYKMGKVVFTGDHVMGWASSLVSPPDGDLIAFLNSCERLKSIPARRFFPGHGAPVEAPSRRLEWLIGHRNARTDQILAALASGPATPSELVLTIYDDVDPALQTAARRNVLAHLIALIEQGDVRVAGALSPASEFELA